LEGARYKIKLKIFVNQEMLQDVRYVIELKRNILSISIFDLLGLTTKIKYVTPNLLNGV